MQNLTLVLFQNVTVRYFLTYATVKSDPSTFVSVAAALAQVRNGQSEDSTQDATAALIGTEMKGWNKAGLSKVHSMFCDPRLVSSFTKGFI